MLTSKEHASIILQLEKLRPCHMKCLGQGILGWCKGGLNFKTSALFMLQHLWVLKDKALGETLSQILRGGAGGRQGHSILSWLYGKFPPLAASLCLHTLQGRHTVGVGMEEKVNEKWDSYGEIETKHAGALSSGKKIKLGKGYRVIGWGTLLDRVGNRRSLLRRWLWIETQGIWEIELPSRRIFQIKRIANAKALRQRSAWCVWGPSRVVWGLNKTMGINFLG